MRSAAPGWGMSPSVDSAIAGFDAARVERARAALPSGTANSAAPSWAEGLHRDADLRYTGTTPHTRSGTTGSTRLLPLLLPTNNFYLRVR
jgi:hypothetical protein